MEQSALAPLQLSAEIAAGLGISVKTVETNLARGAKVLRARLALFRAWSSTSLLGTRRISGIVDGESVNAMIW